MKEYIIEFKNGSTHRYSGENHHNALIQLMETQYNKGCFEVSKRGSIICYKNSNVKVTEINNGKPKSVKYYSVYTGEEAIRRRQRNNMQYLNEVNGYY